MTLYKRPFENIGGKGENAGKGAFTLTDFSQESLKMSHICKITQIITDLTSFTYGLRLDNVHLQFITGCYNVFKANIYDFFQVIELL